MTTLAMSGWVKEVDRGPEWLFIRLQMPVDGSGDHELAEQVWHAMEQQFARRVVLEMEDIKALRSAMIGQLVLLHKRIAAHDGSLRLCRLSDANREAIHVCRLDQQLPVFHDREEAVMAHRSHGHVS